MSDQIAEIPSKISFVKKTTCEKYDIRAKDIGSWLTWAEIALDADSGYVSIVSDYGNWGYKWTHIGQRTLKQFLMQCDNDYLIGKFAGSKKEVPDFDATVKDIKERIINDRRRKYLEKDNARQAYDEIDDIGVSSIDEGDFFHLMSHSDSRYIIDLASYGEILVYKTEPSIAGFFKWLWPVFIEHLKQEESTAKQQ